MRILIVLLGVCLCLSFSVKKANAHIPSPYYSHTHPHSFSEDEEIAAYLIALGIVLGVVIIGTVIYVSVTNNNKTKGQGNNDFMHNPGVNLFAESYRKSSKLLTADTSGVKTSINLLAFFQK